MHSSSDGLISAIYFMLLQDLVKNIDVCADILPINTLIPLPHGVYKVTLICSLI